MSSLITVMDRLMEQAASTELTEHVIEQNHYAVDNVHQKTLGRFENLVTEISQTLGSPEYNCSTEGADNKNPMPKWVTGSRHGEAAARVLRLSYWKRENGVSYLLLRMELDSKDRPTYYNIVLGARRRTKTESAKMDKLRSVDDTSVWAWLRRVMHQR